MAGPTEVATLSSDLSSLRDSAVARILLAGRMEAKDHYSGKDGSRDSSTPQVYGSIVDGPPNGVCHNGDVNSNTEDVTAEVFHKMLVNEMEALSNDPQHPPGSDQAWKCKYCPFCARTSHLLYSHYQFHQQLLTSQSSKPHLEWLSAYRKNQQDRSSPALSPPVSDIKTSQVMTSSTVAPSGVSSKCHPNTALGLKALLEHKRAKQPSASGFLRSIVQAVMKQGNTPGEGLSTQSIYASLVDNTEESQRKRTMSSSSFSDNGEGDNGPVEKRARLSDVTQTQKPSQGPSHIPGMQTSSVPLFSAAKQHMTGHEQCSAGIQTTSPTNYSPPPMYQAINRDRLDDAQPLDMSCHPREIKNEPPDLVVSPGPTTPSHLKNSILGTLMQSPLSSSRSSFSDSGNGSDFSGSTYTNQLPPGGAYCSAFQRGLAMSTPLDRSSSVVSNYSYSSEGTLDFSSQRSSNSVSSMTLESPVQMSPLNHSADDQRSDSPALYTNVFGRLLQDRGVQCQLLTPATRGTHSPPTNNNHTQQCADHQEEGSDFGPNGVVLKCYHCGISFEDDVLFSIHMGCHNHYDPFICNVCGKNCDNRYGFNTHIMRGHSS